MMDIDAKLQGEVFEGHIKASEPIHKLEFYGEPKAVISTWRLTVSLDGSLGDNASPTLSKLAQHAHLGNRPILNSDGLFNPIDKAFFYIGRQSEEPDWSGFIISQTELEELLNHYESVGLSIKSRPCNRGYTRSFAIEAPPSFFDEHEIYPQYD